jgi:hypothetical protein
MLTENWASLSPEEKYETRFKIWMNPEGVEFAPGAEQTFKERTTMIKDALELKKPSRVPICPMIGFFPAFHGGITAEEAMYDYNKLGVAMRKFHEDFPADSMTSAFLIGPGKIFEILDYRLYKWPGHGCAPNTPYQCWEAEYMNADEYDLLINDPSNFWMRVYLPRIFGALKPWQMLSPLTDLIELPFVGASLIPIGIPEVQESFKKYLEAGQAAMEWIGAIAAIDGGNMATFGAPAIMGGFCKAPFDTLGDTLRGTEPLMLDLFRRPAKVHQAMEVLTPLNIEMGVRTATANKCPFVFIPLHKGADGFMSNKQFAEFYWPYLKRVILGLIEEGCVPMPFVEGGYNQRLEFLADPEIPTGKTLWFFDTTDMVKVKETLHGKSCYAGNIPGSLFKAGTPAQVEEYVKDLIGKVGKDGGFILSNGAVLDDAHPDNFKAMFDAGLKYGK